MPRFRGPEHSWPFFCFGKFRPARLAKLCFDGKAYRTGSLYLQQQRQGTVHGEELPYVLGMPLDGNKYDFRRRYNIGETLFSEAMMNWWSSFAYVG